MHRRPNPARDRPQRAPSSASRTTGALAGPLALLLFFATGEPGFLIAPASALEGVLAPLALGGGVAGYLAEGQVSSVEVRWWGLVLVAAAVGVGLGALG